MFVLVEIDRFVDLFEETTPDKFGTDDDGNSFIKLDRWSSPLWEIRKCISVGGRST